jgi:hypothetical protein
MRHFKMKLRFKNEKKIGVGFFFRRIRRIRISVKNIPFLNHNFTHNVSGGGKSL